MSGRSSWLAASCVALACSRASQPSAGESFANEYVSSFNAGEPAMAQFFARHADASIPLPARMERYRRLQTELGRLDNPRYLQEQDRALRVVMDTGKPSQPMTFLFHWAAESSAQLRSIEITNGVRSAPPALAPLAEAQAVQTIAELAEQRATADQFSGALLVARGSEVLWQRAFGYANRETRSPNALDTKFNIGSIGKNFTGVAIAQLVARGAVRPSDTVSVHLPSYPNREVAEHVTLEQLLRMQSGLEDFFGPRYESTPKERLAGIADYLPLFVDQPPSFTPGTRFRYSNAGYIVLGLVIEQVTGVSYYDYVQRHVFEPAGMGATGFFPKAQRVPERASGYTSRFGVVGQNNSDHLPARGSSAGGAYSTVQDLLRYVGALESGELAPQGALEQLGLPRRSLQLTGGGAGGNARVESGIGAGYTVIALSNQDPPAAEDLSSEAARVLRAVRR